MQPSNVSVLLPLRAASLSCFSSSSPAAKPNEKPNAGSRGTQQIAPPTRARPPITTLERLAIDHSVTPPSIEDGGYSPASLDGCAPLVTPAEAQEMDFCRSPRASFDRRPALSPPMEDEEDRPRCCILDFDGTLSTPKYVDRLGNWAVCDKEVLIASLSDEEVWENGGGMERVDLLRRMLETLQAQGCALYIVSLGFTAAIRRHLDVWGLSPFFPPSHVFGQDSQLLMERDFVKAPLIEHLMIRRGWAFDDVLFVDDSQKNIAECDRRRSCATFPVADSGLTEREMGELCARLARNTDMGLRS